MSEQKQDAEPSSLASNIELELKMTPFADTPLRKAILAALHKPTLENIENVARITAHDPVTSGRCVLPKPSEALSWLMRRVGHEPGCNIHTRERPLDGCSCPFGPSYAALVSAIAKAEGRDA